jgi:hypothetical protein
MTLLPDKELGAIEEWFSDVLEALDFAPNTDRGRVLKGIRKLKAEAADYEEEKSKVMSAYGYKRWGDLVRACDSKLIATPEIELPEVFSSWPKKWVLREGGMLYDKAEKRLANETRQAIKKVWAYIEKNEPEQGKEWADEQRAFFIDEFEASEEPFTYEQTCFAFINDYYGDEEGPDPNEVWIAAADVSRAALVASAYLPPAAVDELLDYAEIEGVEITQAQATNYEESEFAGARWFCYLLCAYLTKEQRPNKDHVIEIGSEARLAAGLGKLYDREAGGLLRAGVREGEWDPTTTLGDLETAYRTYKATIKEVDELATSDEVAAAILTALGRQVVKN